MLKKNYRPILMCLLALTFGITAYLMNEQMLWNYESLVLLISIWLFVVLLWKNKITRLPNAQRYISLSFLSAILLYLAFPSVGCSPLLLLAWIPMLVIERDISLHYGKAKKREIFKFAFITALTWNILSTYWVGNSAIFAGFFAVIANALLMTIPWVLGHVVKNKMPKLAYAPLVCFWLTFEYFHFRWDLSWPWLTLGNGFASFHSLVQWYEFVGVLGGSLWIWICNISIFNAWNKFKKLELTKAAILPPSIAVIVPILFSLYQYYTYEIPSKNDIEVVCVQPNYEPHFEQGNDDNLAVLTKCMEMTAGIVDTSTHLLLFPEATFSRVVSNELDSNDVVHAMKIITGMEFPDLNILSGISGFKLLTENEAHLPYVMTQNNGQLTFYYSGFNAALQIGERNVQMYKKSKLVVGPEYMPFGKYLNFLEPTIRSMGGTLKGLETDTERSVFETKKTKIAPVICYEQNFGDFMRGYIKKGAECIAIITNDGWWGKTDGYRQHNEFARLRAIEFRRSIARAANTGASCFINPRGDMFQATDYGVEAVIKQKIPLNKTITNYVVMGDVVGRLAGFLGLLFLLNAFVVTKIKK